jgi:hypothetical protein
MPATAGARSLSQEQDHIRQLPDFTVGFVTMPDFAFARSRRYRLLTSIHQCFLLATSPVAVMLRRARYLLFAQRARLYSSLPIRIRCAVTRVDGWRPRRGTTAERNALLSSRLADTGDLAFHGMTDDDVLLRYPALQREYLAAIREYIAASIRSRTYDEITLRRCCRKIVWFMDGDYRGSKPMEVLPDRFGPIMPT